MCKGVPYNDGANGLDRKLIVHNPVPREIPISPHPRCERSVIIYLPRPRGALATVIKRVARCSLYPVRRTQTQT